MKKLFVLLVMTLSFATPAMAEEIYKIEIGKNYREYSNSDLQRRVWELERAVWQLQQRVFQLESGSKPGSGDTWVCTITAMGNNYVGTGGSKAVATLNATEKCKAAREGDGFFCKNPKCEQ